VPISRSFFARCGAPEFVAGRILKIRFSHTL